MSDYLHGAYGRIQAVGNRVADESQGVIVYVGTAPVHNVALASGEKYPVNRPVLINNIAEARKYFGYSDDWAKYTLCEAMHVHLETKGVGPLVLINVLDPAKHYGTTEATESKTPASGAITLNNADLIDVDSIAVEGKTKDTHYTVAVNDQANTVVLTEKTEGALGTSALNVTYNKKTVTTVSKTPVNNIITIASAGDIILDSIEIKTQDPTPVTKVKGTDYTVSYNSTKQVITITGITNLGTSALTVTYNLIDAGKVDNDDVIGSTDGLGLNTGLYAVQNVYQETGRIPAYLAAPGFSSIPAVHSVMRANSVKVNGHWDVYMFVDLPLKDSTNAQITMATARTWKAANGYTHENETVYFPMATGIDGNKYHLSVLAAANFQELLLEQDGIPYKTASNTECAMIENLYLGADYTGRTYDDKIINENLNKFGIASAAYVGGRWAIWGCHSADYSQTNGDQINVAETNRMMLYYISNDFQHRRTGDVDKPMSNNDLQTIIAEEQTRLDALLKIGALIYGVVSMNAQLSDKSDIMSGDYTFMFDITTTPLAKSLTAIVNWTDDGFVTYFETAAA